MKEQYTFITLKLRMIPRYFDSLQEPFQTLLLLILTYIDSLIQYIKHKYINITYKVKVYIMNIPNRSWYTLGSGLNTKVKNDSIIISEKVSMNTVNGKIIMAG